MAVHPGQVDAARALKPVQERQVLGRSVMLFDRKLDPAEREKLAVMGDVRTPSVADVFVALLSDKENARQGAAL